MIDTLNLRSELLSQIEQANSLGRDPGLKRLLLQNISIYVLIHLLASYIVDFEMDIIIANLKLRFASNNINLEHFLFEVIQIL